WDGTCIHFIIPCQAHALAPRATGPLRWNPVRDDHGRPLGPAVCVARVSFGLASDGVQKLTKPKGTIVSLAPGGGAALTLDATYVYWHDAQGRRVMKVDKSVPSKETQGRSDSQAEPR